MKRAIRTEMRRKRDLLSDEEASSLSLRVMENLFSTPEFRKARTVMLYASFGSEVRTGGMMHEAIRMGKRVALPVVSEKGHFITPYLIKDFPGDVILGAYGILEPRAGSCRKVPAAEIDMVVVPGTAFDERGERVGYGKGYYDRFLAGVPQAVAIGLAYDFQVLDRIPSESHDARVSAIVTDKRVIRC